jgi:hypothetical protein
MDIFTTKFKSMKYLILFALTIIGLNSYAQGNKKDKDFYEMRIYEYHSADQQKRIDDFISKALIPYLHSKKINKIGAFTALANDTAKSKKIFVLIPYKKLADIPTINKSMFSDENVLKNGEAYLNATSENPAYDRMMSIIMEGFRFSPTLTPPSLSGSIADKVYELRSYESASEKKYWKKVEMFNEGGEIPLFARLGFNAVFYAEVISGPSMPNLMYMTSFENMTSRDEHWKSFSNDPEWKKLSSLKEYEKTVSKNTITFLKATAYSEY